jgi:hypothetical protein
MSNDYGAPVHYSAIEPDTPVYDSAGGQVGKIRQVADNYDEHILDGFVIEDADGTVRFVDAPEVARTFEHAVTLTIDADAVAQLGPPEENPGVFGANMNSGRLAKMFGGAWRKK